MVKLVKHTEKHIEPLVELLNNDNISRWLINVPFPYTLEKAEEWVGICNEMKDGKDYGFAIELDGKLIGGIGMNVDGRRDAGLDDHKAQIGYWLGEKYWGKGYMTDALQQVLKLAFDELKLVRVYAYTHEGNTASENVLLRNGFEHEGFIKKGFKKDDKIFNSNLYAKVI